MPLEEQKLLILFIHSAVSSRNIQILLLTKVAKLTPAINELSVSIYSQLKPCGHRAITDAHYYGQNPDPPQKLCFVLLNKRPKTPARRKNLIYFKKNY